MMKGFHFSPLPAGGPRRPDYFERRRRPRGGSARSYSESVKTPASVTADRKRLMVMLALTSVLPPVGIALMWHEGLLKMPMRIAATAAAFFLMVLYFSWIIPEAKPDVYQPPVQKPAAVTEYSASDIGQ